EGSTGPPTARRGLEPTDRSALRPTAPPGISAIPGDAVIRAPEAKTEAPPGPLVAVSIDGAVQVPGLYRLPEGSRVQDLIEAAKGATAIADLSSINRAARLIDGTTLRVPSQPTALTVGETLVLHGAHSMPVNPPEYMLRFRAEQEPSKLSGSPQGEPAKSQMPQPSGASNLIDINKASAAELATLPGIGEVRSRQIVEYRAQNPFKSVDDLRNIHGIGPKTVDSLRSLVTVTPAQQ
ncbi:MAG TPA: ComEA family DNA-binding protein, partial [Candidatus Hydrogenedentes bacterium]|nr:ComEA family DNA-binding protein [Candidatus Hydrogenedentota bacterium]